MLPSSSPSPLVSSASHNVGGGRSDLPLRTQQDTVQMEGRETDETLGETVPAPALLARASFWHHREITPLSATQAATLRIDFQPLVLIFLPIKWEDQRTSLPSQEVVIH